MKSEKLDEHVKAEIKYGSSWRDSENAGPVRVPIICKNICAIKYLAEQEFQSHIIDDRLAVPPCKI